MHFGLLSPSYIHPFSVLKILDGLSAHLVQMTTPPPLLQSSKYALANVYDALLYGQRIV